MSSFIIIFCCRPSVIDDTKSIMDVSQDSSDASTHGVV